MDEIASMSLTELRRLRIVLKHSQDPWAVGAVKLVNAEIERCNLRCINYEYITYGTFGSKSRLSATR